MQKGGNGTETFMVAKLSSSVHVPLTDTRLIYSLSWRDCLNQSPQPAAVSTNKAGSTFEHKVLVVGYLEMQVLV
ncbi:hypothetical protein C5167_009142 [Papaver somniferum]|uniref:Uncharacterized protein n=1 Tax=Papaver somniferum TaxID=3469 RepID=A0A4Y7JWI3_PAPSO|nr:hypothetical protein C5167_009142 [Papaver somniferum]